MKNKFYQLMISLGLSISLVSNAADLSDLQKYGKEAAEALYMLPDALTMTGVKIINDENENYKLFERINFISRSSTTIIIVSNQKKSSRRGIVIQNDTAISSMKFSYNGMGNFEYYSEIRINANEWEKIKGDKTKQVPFMAHEIGVMLNIEETGKYGMISAPLLNEIQEKKIPLDSSKALYVCLLTSIQDSVIIDGSVVKFPKQLGILMLPKNALPKQVFSFTRDLYAPTISKIKESVSDLNLQILPPEKGQATLVYDP